MRDLFKTGVGKTVLFLLHIVSCCALLVSAVAIFIFLDYDIYSKSEESLRSGVISDSLSDDAFELMRLSLFDYHDYDLEGKYDNYKITAPDGNVIRGNYGTFNGRATETYTFKWNVDFNDSEEIINWYPIPNGRDITEDEKADLYICEITVPSDYLGYEDLKILSTEVSIAYYFRYWIFVIAGVSAILFILLFAGLVSVSARVPGSDELKPGVFNKVPIDILIGISALVFTMAFLMADEVYYTRSTRWLIAAGLAVLLICLVDGIAMSIAARVKQKNLIKNSVIYMLLKFTFRLCRAVFSWIGKFLSAFPLIWKTVVLVMLTFFALVYSFVRYNPGLISFLLFIESLIAIYSAYALRKLQKGAERLAAGDLSYKISTDELIMDFKDHGENLNRISVGMDNAVKEQMRSERLKTELITNVSHDIKTPLTSIINYVDLINKEECDNEKINEYVEVLDRQSKRLKKLIEDLIEVSKASTGNLDVELEPSDLGVTLVQAVSEYEDRFSNAGLDLVLKKPDSVITVMADGRRMWRVFDNLLNNICKYGLTGTRVYIDLYTDNGNAVVSFRNVSRDPLSLSADEIAERFTRGDSSRNTEGSGLGLSICKSLVDLQGGTQNIFIDGDLFKVVLTFPLINPVKQTELSVNMQY